VPFIPRDNANIKFIANRCSKTRSRTRSPTESKPHARSRSMSFRSMAVLVNSPGSPRLTLIDKFTIRSEAGTRSHLARLPPPPPPTPHRKNDARERSVAPFTRSSLDFARDQSGAALISRRLSVDATTRDPVVARHRAASSRVPSRRDATRRASLLLLGVFISDNQRRSRFPAPLPSLLLPARTPGVLCN